ncbi:hypothetical protein [Leptothermofonsia sp. ETS-13]|uniref:hypothetical protein n=1 Tax=Leptothermofonsia sp. ETS-13 TaxID=3035696 RepID=UPI003BA3CE1D
MPIVQGPELLGFVAGEIALDRIEALLKNYASERSVQITLVGRNHSVVVSTQPDRKMGQAFNLRHEGDITPLKDQTYQWFPKKGSQLAMAR